MGGGTIPVSATMDLLRWMGTCVLTPVNPTLVRTGEDVLQPNRLSVSAFRVIMGQLVTCLLGRVMLGSIPRLVVFRASVMWEE